MALHLIDPRDSLISAKDKELVRGSCKVWQALEDQIAEDEEYSHCFGLLIRIDKDAMSLFFIQLRVVVVVDPL